MKKISTLILLASAISLAACSSGPSQKTSEPSPVVFNYDMSKKFDSSEYSGFKFNQTLLNEQKSYSKIDTLGNKITVNVSKNNTVKSIKKESYIIEDSEICEANYKADKDSLAIFSNGASDDAFGGRSEVRYGSSSYVINYKKCLAHGMNQYNYSISVESAGITFSNITTKFSDSMADSGKKVYDSATTPSSWFKF